MGLLDGGFTGDPDTNLIDDGLTGDEDTSVISEGWTGEEDSNIASFEGAADAVSNAATIEIANEAGHDMARLITMEESEEAAAEEIQDLYTAPKQAVGQRVDEAVEGTALDHRGTDLGVKVAETSLEYLVEMPFRGVTQTTMGIDPKTGEAVEEVDPELAAEAGLMIGTAGTGRMIGFADEAYQGIKTLGSKSDELWNIGNKSDDVAQRGIDDVSTHIGTDAENARHAENLHAPDVPSVGQNPKKTGGSETTSAWNDMFAGGASSTDETVAGADSLSSAIRSTIGAGSNTLQTALSTTTGKLSAGALALGGSIALAGTGLNQVGALPDPGDGVAMEVVEVFDKGGKLVEFIKGETTSGYGVIIGVDEERNLVGVLDQNGDLRRVPKPNLRARFDSEEAARDAYHAFLDEKQRGRSGEGPMGPSQLPQSEQMTGGLDAPSSAPQAAGFDLSYSLLSDVEVGTNVEFALSTQSGLVPLASESLTFPKGEEVSGTVRVPNGATNVEPGTYPLVAYAREDPVTGVITSTEITISGRKKESPWSSPEIAKELDFGWYLMVQSKSPEAPRGGVTTQVQEQRYIVAGRNSAGEVVYLHEDGRARDSPHTFDDAQRAAKAVQTFSKRLSNGNVSESAAPDSQQDRPQSGEVKTDLDSYDRSSVAGLASRVSSALTSGPAMLAAGAFGLALIGLVILG